MFFTSKKKEETKDDPKKVEYTGVVRTELEFHEGTLRFLTELCRVLHQSYGPLGSNTLIEEGGQPTVTKDGYTILNSLRFSNSQDAALHALIKRVSYNLVKTVGDGSTSAVLSAGFLYEKLAPMVVGTPFRKKIVDAIEAYSAEMIRVIEDELAIKVTSENRQRVLRTIAAVSNNNDVRIGDMIADVFSKFSVDHISDVRIENDPMDSSIPIRTDVRYGFPYERGPAHNLYFNRDGGVKSTFAVEDALVYIAYEFFPDHFEVLKKVQAENPDRPIVAIVEVTHEATVMECMADFLKGKNKIVLIKAIDNSAEKAHEEFLDMAVYLDADVVRDPKEFKADQLGQCKRVEFYGSRTMFIGGQGLTKSTDFFADRIENLQKLYDETPNNLPGERGRIKNRLARLNGVSLKILVGGITEEEKKARRFLVEDAVLACKSACSKGYGMGSNSGMFHAALRVDSRIKNYFDEGGFEGHDPELMKRVSNAMKEVFAAVYMAVAARSPAVQANPKKWIEDAEDSNRVYNVITGEFEQIDETAVLSPIDTDVQILKAAVSIVGMLLSINQLVSC